MISVIICSIRPELFKQVSTNLSRKIGVEHEILSFDNRVEKYGICRVYNILAGKAKFEYLCFLHEDVLFETDDWGKLILEEFAKDANLGLVGIAGAKYKSRIYSGWFTGIREIDCANYLHQYEDHVENVILAPHNDRRTEDVVCIDGVFLFCKTDAWKATRFDEINLKGFHFYDLDFSLRMSRLYQAKVVYNVLIKHITGGGDFGDPWIETAMKFHQLHTDELPATLSDDYRKFELKIAKNTLDVLKNFRISTANKFKWVVNQKLYLYPSLFYGIAKFLVYHPFRLKRLHKLFKSA